MLNILQALRNRREQRRQKRELATYTSNGVTLSRLQEVGMLLWEPNQRRLLIMQPLALLMLKSPETWQNFVRNVFLWTYQVQAQEAWDAYFQREELAAVRRAQGELPAGKTLSRADVERIRRARRQEIALADMQPPRVEPFEFFILPDTTEAAPKPIAVGWFDPEADKQEIAPWTEIEPLLNNS